MHIAVKDSPFWGNLKKWKKVHVFVSLCIHHWNSLHPSLWLPRRIKFLTYYSLKVVSLQKDVWRMTEEIPYWWQVATQIWVSKDSDWLCYSWGWEICFNQTETRCPYSSDIIFTCISVINQSSKGNVYASSFFLRWIKDWNALLSFIRLYFGPF